MKGYIHNQVVGRDTVGSDGSILRKAIYDPGNLPTGISVETLLQLGYQRLNCKFDGVEKMSGCLLWDTPYKVRNQDESQN